MILIVLALVPALVAADPGGLREIMSTRSLVELATLRATQNRVRPVTEACRREQSGRLVPANCLKLWRRGGLSAAERQDLVALCELMDADSAALAEIEIWARHDGWPKFCRARLESTQRRKRYQMGDAGRVGAKFEESSGEDEPDSLAVERGL